MMDSEFEGVLFIVAILINFVWWGIVAGVAVHFISKYW